MDGNAVSFGACYDSDFQYVLSMEISNISVIFSSEFDADYPQERIIHVFLFFLV